mgnify:CR=1 FL=1
MDLDTFLRLATQLNDMGWVVTEQLTSIAAGKPIADQNFNVLRIIQGFLTHLSTAGVEGADELMDEIEAAMEENTP